MRLAELYSGYHGFLFINPQKEGNDDELRCGGENNSSTRFSAFQRADECKWRKNQQNPHMQLAPKFRTRWCTVRMSSTK